MNGVITQINQMISEQLILQTTGEEQKQRVYKVDLNNKLITRISNLNHFTRLRCLQLDFNRIRKIENLQCLPDLRELHLQYNEIQKIEGLGNNKMLTVLLLNNNQIEKIQNVKQLAKLQTFMLDNNKVNKISELETLKDLKYLSMSGNKLTAIDSIPAFSKLQTLIADNNKISQIDPNIFGTLTKLTKLSLKNNRIAQTSFLSPLSCLQQLTLSHNQITNCNFSNPLRNLQYLDISNNQLQTLPKISQFFPQLSTFIFSNNQIYSQYQIIQSLSEVEMLVEIDYRNNPMQTPNFMQTLYRVHGFDRINGKDFNKPGTKYLNEANKINEDLHDDEFREIQNNEDVRKIIMSGFNDEGLETSLTGVKPDRPNSGRKRTAMLNFEQMQKNYNEIMDANGRIQHLRNQCLNIFKQNGIVIEVPYVVKEQQQKQQSVIITSSNNLADRTSLINTMTQISARRQENSNKWNQIKKNFNIRGARRISDSQKKGVIGSSSNIRQASAPKTQQRPDLMKTQLNPPTWARDPAISKTISMRPISAKKK